MGIDLAFFLSVRGVGALKWKVPTCTLLNGEGRARAPHSLATPLIRRPGPRGGARPRAFNSFYTLGRSVWGAHTHRRATGAGGCRCGQAPRRLARQPAQPQDSEYRNSYISYIDFISAGLVFFSFWLDLESTREGSARRPLFKVCHVSAVTRAFF